MLTYLVAFLLAATTSFVLTPIMRKAAHHYGWLDHPDGTRKVHERAIPRVGGIAIGIAFFVPVLGLFFLDNGVSRAYLSEPFEVVGLIGGALAMMGLGFVDDVRGLGAKQKFAFQLAVATAVYFLGFQISKIANPFGDDIMLGVLSYPVTMLWIVGVVNAINLIDGVDGLAGGISLFSVLTIFVLSLVYPNHIAGLTAIALAGSLVGFLRYNLNPASIFMGDSGSLFLGFVLASTGIMSSMKSATVVALIIPILALGLPIMDTSMAVFRRFIGGRPLFKGDRGHFHHRLLDLGFTEKQVVIVLTGGCAICGAMALAMVSANSNQAALLLALFGFITVAFTRWLGYLNLANMRMSVRYGLMRQPRLRSLLEEIQSTGDAIRAAETTEDVLRAIVDFARVADLDRMSCVLTLHTAQGVKFYEAQVGATPITDLSELTQRHRLEVPIDWALEDVSIEGHLAFQWACDEETLQLPEAPGYDWLAMLLRDKMLELSRVSAPPKLRLTTRADTA